MIAITGAAGFIGSNLAQRLAEMGQELMLMDLGGRMSTERRHHVEPQIAGRKPLASLVAWFAANRSRFKPGSVNQAIIMHDHTCRYPWAEPCTCVPGPEIRLVGERSENN